MIDVLMKMKFSINEHSQVSNRVCPGYGGLAGFIIIDQDMVFLEKDINLVLLMLSFI
jgi:hypothetical protein